LLWPVSCVKKASVSMYFFRDKDDSGQIKADKAKK